MMSSTVPLLRPAAKPHLRRHLTPLSLTSYSLSLLGVTGSIPATISFPLLTGGPATAIYTWALGSLMSLTIAFSVSELVSAYPTAGGMYFVTRHVVPARHLPFAAWCVGWANLLGQIAGATGLVWSVAEMAAVGWGGAETSRGVTVVMAGSVLAVCGLVCSLSTRRIHNIVIWFAPLNLLIASLLLAVLLTHPHKHPLHHVLTDFTSPFNLPIPFNFLLGFTSVTYTLTAYDGTTHLSEETRSPSRANPLAINTAITTSALLGLALTTCICLCTPSPPPRSPLAYALQTSSLPPVAASALWAAVIALQSFTAFCALLAAGRMMFAFSRDGALPAYFSHINDTTRTPLRAVWGTVAGCVLLLALGSASEEGMVGVFNLTAPMLDASYAVVIWARWHWASEMRWKAGDWGLGQWSRTVNKVAVTWVGCMAAVLMLPVRWPVRWENMNYAPVVAVVGGILVLGSWEAGKRRYDAVSDHTSCRLGVVRAKVRFY